MLNYEDYKKDKEKTLGTFWSNGLKNYQQIQPRLRQNWQLYNLVSELLQARAALGEDLSVLFIPVIYPSIESRTATIMSELLNNLEALSFKAFLNSPDYEADQKKAENCNTAVDFAFYLNEWEYKARNWVEAAEIYPVVFAKAYVDEIKTTEPEIVNTSLDGLTVAEQLQIINANRKEGEPEITIQELPGIINAYKESLPPKKKMKVKSRTIYKGPFFDILSPHECLYDFNVRHIQESSYVIHWKRVDRFYLKAKYPHLNLTDDILDKQTTETDELDYDVEEEVEVGREPGREGKRKTIDFVEIWFKVIENDEVKYKVVWGLPKTPDPNDSTKSFYILDEKDPVEIGMDGVRFPFVQLVLRPRPNKLEGMATADILAPLQHEKSDLHNMIMDTLHYTLGPIIIAEEGAIRSPKTPEFSPRSIWTLSRIDAVKPFHIPNINIDQALAMTRLVEENAQNLASTPDFVRGSDFIKTDQTLGEARIKQAGAGRRIGLSILQVFRAIKELKLMFLTILRQTIDEKLEIRLSGGRPSIKELTMEDLLVNVDIYIPNLPALADRVAKEVQADRQFERLSAVPLIARDPQAQLEILRDYLNAHEYPADRKKIIFETLEKARIKSEIIPILLEIIQKAGIPLPPELVQFLTQDGKKQTVMPKTSETLGAAVPG